MDLAHLPVSHTRSKRPAPSLPQLALSLTSPLSLGGFAGVAQPSGLATTFHAPSLVVNTLPPRFGGACPLPSMCSSSACRLTSVPVSHPFSDGMLNFYVTPTTPGSCLLLVRNPIKVKGVAGLVFRTLPRWAHHIRQNGILDDDTSFLAAGERALADAMGGADSGVGGATDTQNGSAVPSSASSSFARACCLAAQDFYVLTFRAWAARFAGGGPWGSPLSAQRAVPHTVLQTRLPTRADFVDRVASHLALCASCRGAADTFALTRAFASAAAAILLAASVGAAAAAATVSSSSPLSPAACVAALCGAVCGLVALLSHRLVEALRSGPLIPPRNRVPLSRERVRAARK